MKTHYFLAAAFFVSTMTLAQTTPAKTTTKAAKLTPEQVHNSAIVIDTHEDTPQRFLDDHWNFGDPLGDGQVNLDAIHKGNLGASFMSIWVEPDLYKGHFARRTLELIDAVASTSAQVPSADQTRHQRRRHRAGPPRAQVRHAHGH